MNIGMVGCGYVGLVSGVCFADTGHKVTCLDVDPEKVRVLTEGRTTIYEPGLQHILERNLRSRRIRFTTDPVQALAEADVIFLAVQTPPVAASEGGMAIAPDLQYIQAAAETCGKHIKAGAVVVTKSTVPVGTHNLVREAVATHAKVPFAVACNPEFLKEGAAVDDFMRPERVVIGVEDETARQLLVRLYEPYVRSGAPILVMDPASAEMTKYACNAFLAMKISFINLVASLSEQVGGDVEVIRRGMITDSRIGKQFLYPGVGYGGSCFPKDVRALAHLAEQHGVDSALLTSIDAINERQKERMFDRVLARFDGKLAGRVIAVWGLAFKPRTDDVREAPSLVIIERLLAAGANVRVFDPEAMSTTRARLGDRILYAQDEYEAAEGADALVVVTEWNEFRRPDFGRLKELMKAPVLFDGRNLYSPDDMQRLGIEHHSIGRKKNSQ